MTEDAARRGTRDNGLRCGAYSPAADVDPRVADALLSALRDEGIAASAARGRAAPGGLRDPGLRDSPPAGVGAADRELARAKGVGGGHGGGREEAPAGAPDIDAAWQQVL